MNARVSSALLVAGALGCVLTGAVHAARPAPPPEPLVTPIIVHPREIDRDSSRVDDDLETRTKGIRSKLAMEKHPGKRAVLQASLDELVKVELVFSNRITQEQIDGFLALGGRIDHVYQAVSYGWTGSAPLGALESLPEAMGESLVAVIRDRPIHATLDEATQCGRVRPVWANGFAGTGGLGGDTNTTIAILDSGVDASHQDLQLRKEYWKDWTATNYANATDYNGHGTHVSSIASGTGSAGGTSGTLYYTDMDDASTGTIYSTPIHIASGTVTTFTSTAKWHGGGLTNFYQQYRADGGTGGYTAIATVNGASPQTLTSNFTSGANQYRAYVAPNGAGVNKYVIKNSVTNYPASADSRYRFLGVAPGCQWAGIKVLLDDNSGWSTDFGEGVDDCVTQKVAHNIKVANMSLGIGGSPGIDETLRAKVNTAVNNGIVMCISAGNDGPGTGGTHEIDDPGRAALAITVGSSNDINQLTRYTSCGFSSPGSNEDQKPDLLAPGGSWYYSGILAAETNHGDMQNNFTEQQANDYHCMCGTSMASPFVAGAAAIVVQALESSGVSWDFNSSATALQVKMLLCASATETNQNREVSSGTNPTLGRASTPKDDYEGYGIINPDAAAEAVLLPYYNGPLCDSSAGGYHGRRAWGRRVSLPRMKAVTFDLAVPMFSDYDLYLYSSVPDAKGNPVILASSCNAGADTDESITYTATDTETDYLMIKRVTGTGTWTLTGTTDSDAPDPGSATSPQYANSWPVTVSYSGAHDHGTSGLKKIELWYKKGSGGAWTNSTLTQTGASGSFNFTGTAGDSYYYFDLVAEDNAGNRSAEASGSGECSMIFDQTPPSTPGYPSTGSAYKTTGSITWTWDASTDNMSGVASYRCAVGSTPDGEDLGTGDTPTTSYTIAGQLGSAYFCKVKARDNAGNWSGYLGDWLGTTYVEHGGIGIGAAKQLPFQQEAGPSVGLSGLVLTNAYGWPYTMFYVEQQGHVAGIRVEPLSQISWGYPGAFVQIGGRMSTTADHEKYIANATIFPTGDGLEGYPPVYLSNKRLGGGDYHWNWDTFAGQQGVLGGVGLNNIGLWVRTTGHVAGISEDRYTYWINDLSISNSMYTSIQVIDENRPILQVGNYVIVTGALSCGWDGEFLHPVIHVPLLWWWM
ncbi:MAG: S8 family serine peptidase [Armatimonadetes bacterium]|nr:S8 family serine peptidase [Armatimonadota bacterium]